MSKPDRFEKMVGQVRWSDPDIPVMMLRLLRRQHNAYVRMVRRAANAHGDLGLSRSMKLDLLAAFAHYKKGTR